MVSNIYICFPYLSNLVLHGFRRFSSTQIMFDICVTVLVKLKENILNWVLSSVFGAYVLSGNSSPLFASLDIGVPAVLLVQNP